MRYLPLIWVGLWRKKLRTIFTFVSIVFAFLLFGLLQGFNTALHDISKGADLNGLFTYAKHTGRLPASYRAKIAAASGVTAVSFTNWIGGYYQVMTNRVAAIAVDAATYFEVWPELTVDRKHVDALIRTRTGAIAGTALMKKHGWKIGDHIPIKSQVYVKRDGSSDWELDIVGSYSVPENPEWSRALLFNYSYLDEARLQDKGRVDIYYVRIDDPAHAAAISEHIDALFANSSDETQTMSQKENMQANLKQFGDVGYIVNSVVACVFFTLLMLTGNTMVQSVRERIPEFAVLKTIGFTDARVITLVFAESLLLCLPAACLGLAAAHRSFHLVGTQTGLSKMPLAVIPICLAYAAALALLVGLLPALRLQRLSVVDALAGR